MKKCIQVLFVFACLFMHGLMVSADDSETETLTVSVTDYGADGSDTADDSDAFKRAMNEALHFDGNLVVTIPEGTFYLSDDVPVYSDTAIIADVNALIKATYTHTTPMLYGAHTNAQGDVCSGGSSCTHGGYSQTHDVTISGGTWDRGTANSSVAGTIFSFRHAQNITIRNLTVKNCTDHFINISGVDTALIDHVNFVDAIACTGTSSDYWGSYSPGDIRRYTTLEAIHMDYCNKTGENSDRARPWDDTPAKNITVNECDFSNVFVGVGNHHPAVNGRATNIIISNNTFTNVLAYTFYSNGFDGLVINGNTITDAGSFGSFTDSDLTAENNTCSITDPNGLKYNGIHFPEGTTALLKNNMITNAALSGIGIYKGSKITIQGGTITNPGTLDSSTFGVYLENNAKAIISGLTITKSPSHGIYVKNSSDLTINDSQISKTAESGIYLDKQSVMKASGVTITGSKKFGIMVKENCSAIIKDTSVGTEAEAAYRIMSAEEVSLVNCTATATAGRDIYATDTGNVKIKKCVFNQSASGFTAITIINSPTKVIGNSISNAGSHGIVVEKCDKALIKNNKVSNCAGIGIQVKNSSDCMIDSNTINNKKSSSSHALEIKGESSKRSSATIRNNYLNAPNSGSYDLKIGAYTTVTLRTNTLVNSKQSCDSTSSTNNAKVFSDVKKGKFYFDAVAWAYDYGVTTGKSSTKFAPEENCTRAEIVTFIWRMMGCPEPENSKYNAYFTDAESGKFYVKAINWAREQNITTGLNDGTGRFGVSKTCTRAMCVTFLWRAAGMPEPSVIKDFIDVSDTAYYYRAVVWAAENGITKGVNEQEFAPNLNVTRGQTVTFMYRYVLSDYYED